MFVSLSLLLFLLLFFPRHSSVFFFWPELADVESKREATEKDERSFLVNQKSFLHLCITINRKKELVENLLTMH